MADSPEILALWRAYDEAENALFRMRRRPESGHIGEACDIGLANLAVIKAKKDLLADMAEDVGYRVDEGVVICRHHFENYDNPNHSEVVLIKQTYRDVREGGE